MIFYIIFILPILTFGQSVDNDTCVLPSENIIWKKLFENTHSKRIKIDLISKKIKGDAIFRVYKPTLKDVSPYLYPECFDERGNDCGIKILFVLRYSQNLFLILDLYQNPNYSFLINELSDENIKNISAIFDSKSAESLYGSFGRSGVVILNTEDKKMIRKIKNLMRK